jgi:hypothetical protein
MSPEELVLAQGNWERVSQELDAALDLLRDHRTPGECAHVFCSGAEFSHRLNECGLDWSQGLLQVALTRILEMEKEMDEEYTAEQETVEILADPQTLSAIEEAELEAAQQRFLESGEVHDQVEAFLADPSVGARVERP